MQDGEDTGFFIFSAGQDVTEQFLPEPVQVCRQTPDALPVRASAVPVYDAVSAAQTYASAEPACDDVSAAQAYASAEPVCDDA